MLTAFKLSALSCEQRKHNEKQKENKHNGNYTTNTRFKNDRQTRRL